MIVTTQIIMQRRNPNGSQKSYYRSHRIATEMCSATGSHAQHTGVVCSQLMEAEDSYKALFENLKERGMATPKFVISDARAGLTAAIRKSFPGASWQRCKVHFMRNILAHIPLSGTLFANIP